MKPNHQLIAIVVLFVVTALFSQQIEAQTRVGLHVTQEELNIWRQRAQSGPYRTTGDVSPNSPGDWARIVANRNAFASNPSNGRWTSGPTNLTNGCVNTGFNDPPNWGSTDWTTRLRDAAFHNLVMGVTTDHAAIKQELLWISSVSWAQFGNPNGIWCFGVLWDRGSSFIITSWLTRILFAYDYMPRSAFSQAELDQIDRWFFDAAEFWVRDADQSMRSAFVDRWGGNYTLTDSSCSNPHNAYVGGPGIADAPAKFLNNRRGGIVHFTTMAAIYLTQAGRNYPAARYMSLANIREHAKMYVREYVRFALFPQGVVSDFWNRIPSLPDLGLAYSLGALSDMVRIADTFARVGDTSLYDFSTDLGACGTQGTINDGGPRQGQNRSLRFAVESIMKYHTDVYSRYWPTTGDEDNRIDGRHPRSGSWHFVGDAWFAFSNIVFKDEFIKRAYMRTHPGAVSYPPSPASCGAPSCYTGGAGILPAVLFMHGQMEGSVWPYPGEKYSTPAPPTSPTALNVY